MILSPMFKFHLLVPAAERGERSEHRGETRENRPVPGAGQWATVWRAVGHWAERE